MTNTENKQERTRKVVVSAAQFWNFNENEKFFGTYEGQKINDDGELIGYRFKDQQGMEWLIGNSHSIEKALQTQDVIEGIDNGVLFEITFLGKVTLKNGRDFNKYEVAIWE